MSEENEKKTGLDLKPAQIAAGALAAVTAAFLGSKLNVAGTISGAAVASVVSTIGGTLYQRSIERTRESVRKVGDRAWVVRPVEGAKTPGTSSAEVAENTVKTEMDERGKTAETRRWPRIAAGAVLIFVLGMLAVTGVEWVRGEPLSGGSEGTTLGAVVGKPTERREQAPAPSTSDAPATSTAPTGTSSAPPSGTSASAPTTTTEPTAPSTSAAPSTGTSSTPAQPGSQTPAPTAAEPSSGL